MFAALASSQQLRLRPITNTQGTPSDRLSILASQGSSTQVSFAVDPL
jgi:hypothetical protein